VWLGYRAPAGPELLTRFPAWSGGRVLDRSLDGLAAARRAVGGRPARTTVLAHSYGTVVVDEAADAPGPLAADAVVLLGSPGMEDDAAALEVPSVFDAAATRDPIAHVGWFGASPWTAGFGSTALPVGITMDHSDYYDPGAPTLAALREVVAGRR